MLESESAKAMNMDSWLYYVVCFPLLASLQVKQELEAIRMQESRFLLFVYVSLPELKKKKKEEEEEKSESRGNETNGF